VIAALEREFSARSQARTPVGRAAMVVVKAVESPHLIERLHVGTFG